MRVLSKLVVQCHIPTKPTLSYRLLHPMSDTFSTELIEDHNPRKLIFPHQDSSDDLSLFILFSLT